MFPTTSLCCSYQVHHKSANWQKDLRIVTIGSGGGVEKGCKLLLLMKVFSAAPEENDTEIKMQTSQVRPCGLIIPAPKKSFV